MAWFDKTSLMRDFIGDLIDDVFVANGWKLVGKYRVKYQQTYARAFLFKSTGSDSMVRYFGMAFGYTSTDGSEKIPERLCFYTFEGYISKGLVDDENVGTGDGSTTVFNLDNYPIVEGSLKVYLDGVETTEFTVNVTTGQITFNTAPGTGVVITADYEKIDWGDITSTSSITLTPTGIMTAVYGATSYVFPSKPTVVSFVSRTSFGNLWYPESEIYYWGNATEDRIVMFFRLDPTPDEAAALFTPLYIGRIDPLGEIPQGNNIIIGGTVATDEISDSTTTLGSVNVDYGPYTSNGNSSIQLQRSKGGARYQAHYLAFITHDQDADHPEGRFNPSRYSGKYHLSPVYIVHPENGFVGKMIDCYAVHPKNIIQMDELEVYEDVTGEMVGTGNGTTTVFTLDFTPIVEGSVQIFVNSVATTDFTLDLETGQITFNTAPASGTVITANYQYTRQYRYTLPNTPRTPFVLNTASPYTPIGLAILKQ